MSQAISPISLVAAKPRIQIIGVTPEEQRWQQQLGSTLHHSQPMTPAPAANSNSIVLSYASANQHNGDTPSEISRERLAALISETEEALDAAEQRAADDRAAAAAHGSAIFNQYSAKIAANLSGKLRDLLLLLQKALEESTVTQYLHRKCYSPAWIRVNWS